MASARRVIVFVLLALMMVAGAPGPLRAQADDAVPATEEDLARISDAELRALLLERLAPPPEEAGADFNPADLAFALQARLARIRDRLGAILSTYHELPGAMANGVAAMIGDRQAADLSVFAALFVLSLAIGAIAEGFVRRRTGFAVRPPPPNPSLGQKVARLAGAVAGHALWVALFAGVAAVVFLILHGGPGRERVAFAFYLAATVILRLIGGFARAYAGSGQPEMRIPAFTDAEARRVHTSILVTIGVGAFGFFTCALFATLGVHGDVHLLLLMIVGTVLALGLAVTFVANRRALAHDLGASGPGPSRRRFAILYPWVLAVGVLLVWVALVATTLAGSPPLFGAGLATVALMILWPSLDAAAWRETRQVDATGDALGPPVLRVMRIALGVATLFLLAVLWRVDLAGAGIGAAAVRSLLQVGAIVLLAYAAWEALRLWINRKIAAEDAAAAAAGGVDMTEAEIGGTGLSRMRTLLPLFKRAGQITIAVIAVLVVLSSLGVDIGPVLAGAGVIGIAIGFGSQTLVRDIVSGAFFLMDDAFRLGEYIDLGTVKGSVERINTRSLQLRHHRGALHTVPFGEIQTLTNYSRDWAIMKLKFRVPFDTDIERVRKLLKTVGKELLEHPDIGSDFLQPLKSQGVVEVDDYGLVISTKFMSKPGKQFLIRRYAYAAMQKALADSGIAFARPEVRVSVDRPDDGDAERDAVQGAAAALAKISQPKAGAAGG